MVMDMEFANHPLGHYRVEGGRLTYSAVGGAAETVDVDCVIEFTSDAARFSLPQDPRVMAVAEVA